MKKRKNEPANCSECKFYVGGKCKKTKEAMGPFDWCYAGRKR